MSRAEDNDQMRRRDSLYELNDRRNDGIETNPDRRYRVSEMGDDRTRSFDYRHGLHADAQLVAYYRDETPSEQVTGPIIDFVPERVTEKAWGVRFSTERAIEGDALTRDAHLRENYTPLEADPNDEGFILYLPKSQARLISESRKGRITIELAQWLYDANELEGLYTRNPINRQAQ